MLKLFIIHLNRFFHFRILRQTFKLGTTYPNLEKAREFNGHNTNRLKVEQGTGVDNLRLE